MTHKLSSTGRTERELLIGLGFMAAIFVAQGLIGSVLDRGSEARTRQLHQGSLSSIEQVTNLARAVQQQRVLVGDHILATPGDEMVAIERRLSEAVTDVQNAKVAYAPFAELPNEATVWHQAQTSLDRFDRSIAAALELSRKDQDAEAQARLGEAIRGYPDLDRNLTDLIRLNNAGANDALHQVEQQQARNEAAQWVTRIAGLFALLVFGWWGTRRIARYEKQMTVYAQEIEGRNRDLDAFAGRVAHDLRNALGPIVMSPSLLRQSSRDPSRVLEIADRTERCSGRATSVVSALLAFSRAAQSADANESAQLDSVLSDVQEELSPLATQLDVSIEVGEIPDVAVRCSPGLLHIVLANLCGNAVKFVEGREERRVCISAYEEDSLCRMEVQDTGPGIPEEAQGRIFEPFFRVEGTRAPGTGIGLATVRRILEARGGRIAVESAVGKGSRFTVWLPVVTQAEARRPEPGPEIRGHRPRPSAG